ncbi:ABC transporter ATP-binding protein/permease [Spiroplasma gladiatoris]|uniref:ABC transporter ATP-binding protein/permease n=1 Tax=Spiroplasma gladiatoris TaxID=2143 RepID=A0A4P7AGE3_9MOLU|nr:ABC transporter ATP-binding protein/permease [Spiroplasma gladiatoris]QBQ07434.1 ABC transporter ATP-binding protein/permease [Spiroplasma gladiatoris]
MSKKKKEKYVTDKQFSFKKMFAALRMVGGGIKRHPILFFLCSLTTVIDSIAWSFSAVVVKGLTTILLDSSNNTKTSSLYGIVDLTWQQWIYLGIGMFLLFVLMEFLTNITSGMFSKKLEIDVRKAALKHLVEIDISYYSKNQIGLIMTRVIGDSQSLGDSFNQFYLTFIWMLGSIFSTVAIMFSINTTLATIAVSLLILMLIVITIMFIFFRRANIISFDVRQKIDADIIDRLINVRLIKATGSENFETKRNFELHKKYDVRKSYAIKWQAFLNVFNGVMISLLPIIMLIINIFLYQDKMPRSEFSSLTVTFISASTNFLINLSVLTQILGGIMWMSNCAMRLNYIFNEKTIINFEKQPIKINSIETIEFKDVSFNYPESPTVNVLPKINISFEKGKSYAFVGETGVGKSTIAKMLLRFYDVTTGELLINGINIKKLDLSNYLSYVGYVEQEPQILYGTVMDNLKYSLGWEASDSQAIEASKKAKLHDFIESLPDKYDTILGERGFMFSGGQKQRLIIARLFLKNPQLLILDEATSALDNIVEKEIQSELDLLMKDRTTIVIAHRLSTIKNVDSVIVLERNIGISQIGSFDELKKVPGRFQKLYNYGLLK